LQSCFYSPEYFKFHNYCIFFPIVLSSLLYASIYQLRFAILGAYLQIFIAFQISLTSYFTHMRKKILIVFFSKLENDLTKIEMLFDLISIFFPKKINKE